MSKKIGSLGFLLVLSTLDLLGLIFGIFLLNLEFIFPLFGLGFVILFAITFPFLLLAITRLFVNKTK